MEQISVSAPFCFITHNLVCGQLWLNYVVDYNNNNKKNKKQNTSLREYTMYSESSGITHLFKRWDFKRRDISSRCVSIWIFNNLTKWQHYAVDPLHSSLHFLHSALHPICSGTVFKLSCIFFLIMLIYIHLSYSLLGTKHISLPLVCSRLSSNIQATKTCKGRGRVFVGELPSLTVIGDVCLPLDHLQLQGDI